MEKKFSQAAYASNVELLKKILRKNPDVDVNCRNELEPSRPDALYLSCRGGHDSIVAFLLAHPAIDVNLRNRNGYTPFFVACEFGKTSCVRLLLQDSRVKVNEANESGSTPLRNAAGFGHVDVIKVWIASGREMDLGTPGNATTDAIGEAEKEGWPEVVTLLERFKRDPTETRSEVRRELGISGQSPLTYLPHPPPPPSPPPPPPLPSPPPSPLLLPLLPPLPHRTRSLVSLCPHFRFPCLRPSKAHARRVRRLPRFTSRASLVSLLCL